jgi:hypothetical protein
MSDHREAYKQELIAKRDHLDRLIAAIEMETTITHSPFNHSSEQSPKRIRHAIQKWIKDTGKKPGDFFAAIEISDYLQSKGFRNKNMYNSTYEALKRLAEPGKKREAELEKVEGGFRAKRNK